MEFKLANEDNKGGFTNAPKSDNHHSFENCNICIPSNLMVIDIDNGINIVKAEKILNKFNITTMMVQTTRGVHLWFKKPLGIRLKKEYVCKIGVKCEYKNSRNTPQGLRFKRKGVARNIINEDLYDNLPELPNFLLPHSSGTDLSSLGDGDGRNNGLFSHMCNITEDRELIANIINEYVFDEPLDDSEIQNILKFDASSSANDILNIVNEVMITLDTQIYNNRLYFKFDNDKYISDERRFYHKIATTYVDLLSKDHVEIYKQCCAKSPWNDEREFPINIRNGHIFNGEFKPFRYTGFTPFYIDISYNKNAKESKVVREYLDHISGGDKDYEKNFIQMFTYPLIYDFSYKSSHANIFFIVGDGANGKGTTLKLLRALYNPENASANSPEDLLDNSRLPRMRDKLINLGDDVEDKPINTKAMKMLKNISTADTIVLRDLYEKASEEVIAPTLIFATNHLLKSFEKGIAYKRRVRWFPLYNKPSERKPNFISELLKRENLEYFFKLMIEELPNVYENGIKFCDTVLNYTEEYHFHNDPSLLFYTENEEVITEEYLDGETKFTEVYDHYLRWHEENFGDDKPLSKKKIKETLEENNIDTSVVVNIGGKTQRVMKRRSGNEKNKR